MSNTSAPTAPTPPTPLQIEEELIRRVTFNTKMVASVGHAFRALAALVNQCVLLKIDRTDLVYAMKTALKSAPQNNILECLASLTHSSSQSRGDGDGSDGVVRDEPVRDEPVRDEPVRDEPVQSEDQDSGEEHGVVEYKSDPAASDSDDDDDGDGSNADMVTVPASRLPPLIPKADGAHLPSPEHIPWHRDHNFNLRISFKRNSNRDPGPSSYDHKVVTPDEPLDIGRSAAFESEDWKRERQDLANAQSFSPPKVELRSLLASKGVHMKIFWAPYTEAEQRQVETMYAEQYYPGAARDNAPRGRYVMRVEKPMTNPTWLLEDDGWHPIQNDTGFTWEVRNKQKYCIGGRFVFKVAFEAYEHTQRRSEPRPLWPMPVTITELPEDETSIAC